MDINKLEYFFAAAELQNFSKAAEKCNIAQTTMSKYIATLENEVGVPLFHRTKKGCSLTIQGQSFYLGMKKLYSDYTDIVSSLLADEKAELRIGIDGEFFKLTALQAFENEYRNIRLSISFASRDVLFESLRQQSIHALILPDIIMPAEFNETGFVTVDLMSEEGFLTFSSITKERFATVGDMLETLPFITKSSDKAYHDYCREVLFSHYGSRFNEVQVVESNSRQQLLVSLSQGFAIIPAAEIASGMDLKQQPIGPEFNETLQLIYNRKHVTAYLKEFIRFIKSQA